MTIVIVGSILKKSSPLVYMAVRAERLPNLSQPSHIVSYFEHEFTDVIDVKKDVQEIIRSGFNSVVITVSEKTLYTQPALEIIKKFVDEAQSKGLRCFANPWGMGKVFGGEGESPFLKTQETACFCNKNFDMMMNQWVDTVAGLGVDGIFWDEPEARCKDHDTEELVVTYSKRAREYGLYNSVCIPADVRQIPTLMRLAASDTFDEIAVDPYFPNAFGPIQDEGSYTDFWIDIIQSVSEISGKACHLWIQGFDTQKSDLERSKKVAERMRNKGVNNLAYWGFKGCAQLFPQVKDGYATPQEMWAVAKEIFAQESLRRMVS